MTAPNVSERVLAIFDEALEGRPGLNTAPSMAIESAVSAGTSAIIDGLVDRWDCENDECPGRPAWDRALSETWDRITDNAEETMREAFPRHRHPGARGVHQGAPGGRVA